MRQRRISDTDDYLLDDADDEDSSTSSEHGNCNWMILTGIFIIQLVVSGVLASYGVLLVSLVEETGVSLREAIWTPVTYSVSCCLADPLCRRVSDRRRGQGCRLLAATGVLIAAGGLAATTLLHRSRLQVLSYGLLGGLGTSLVLTQAKIIIHCHYPRHSHNAMVPHCVSQMGSALALFSMPLLLLGFISVYGSREALLLQAGVVLQGLVGALTLIPPTQRPRIMSRYQSRPRTFTFVGTKSQSTTRRDSYINDIYTRRSSLMSTISSRSWRNPAYCNNNSLELTNCSSKQPLLLENSSRCNKNGVDILPEIPEESEENYDSDCSDIHEDACAVNSDVKARDKALHSGARSMDSCLDIHKVDVKLTDDCIDNKRWSIGTVEEIMPVCIENGLAKYWSISENNKIDKGHKGNKSFENSCGSVELECDKEGIRNRSSLFPVNSALWTTKSLCEVGSNFDTADISEFDPLMSNSMDTPKSHCARNIDHIMRKVRSMEDIVPAFGKVSFINQNDTLNEDVLISDVNSVFMHSSDEVSTCKYENNVTRHVNNVKLPYDRKHVQKRWSTGGLEQILSANAKLSTEDVEVTGSDNYQKWYSTENGNCNQSLDHTGFSHKLIPNGSLTREFPEDHRNVTITGDKCHEYTEARCLSPDSGESEYQISAAKLMSSETVAVDGASHSCQGSNSLRHCSRCSSCLSQVLQRLILSCTCHIHHCHGFRREYTSNLFTQLLCCLWEYVTIPYFFPSLLLRFALRLCPMGFAALSPSLAKKVIDGCTNEEAAFSVSISGFVWLCFLLLSPWCSKISPDKRKYLFAAGNVVAASGLYLLSKTESHDSLTLGCGIFGLGLGATIIMGNSVMHEALGTWNLAKVDVILDLTSGVLILITGFLMDLILMDHEGLSSCFTLLAVVYLVTGISWLLSPLVNRLSCQCEIHSVWSATGGHHLTSG